MISAHVSVRERESSGCVVLSDTSPGVLRPWLVHTEAEQFIEINTQKLSENKYLCPLSGKKFKGPEFVRKHIFNKHQDKVEAVKKEVGRLVGIAENQ